jgi:D-alanine-D-alanine ligase
MRMPSYPLSTSEKRIGVIRGGVSPEYTFSLETGQCVLDSLRDTHSKVEDIFIDKNGEWHLKGKSLPPFRILAHCDIIYNALHGCTHSILDTFRTIERYGVEYTGTTSISTALAFSHSGPRLSLKKRNIKHIPYRILKKENANEERLRSIFESMLGPFIVRPAHHTKKYGISLVETFEDLLYAVFYAYTYSDTIVIEQFMEGKEINVIIVDNFRDEKNYIFHPIEIQKEYAFFKDEREEDSFDNENERKKYIIPATLSSSQKKTLYEYAKNIYNDLSLRDYAQIDFILRKDGTYLLNVHPHPFLGEKTFFSTLCESTGVEKSYFFDHIISQADKRKGRKSYTL